MGSSPAGQASNVVVAVRSESYDGDRSSKVESRIVIPVVGGSSPLGHPITPQARCAEILRESARGIESNARGALASEDPEFLHQLRVNSRRLRSALRAFRPILPRKDAKRLRRSLRKLSPALGRARDWDVLAGRLGAACHAKRHQAARREARDALQSQAFAKMLRRARALQVRDSPESLAQFGAAALSRTHRKLVKAARDIDWSDAAQRHAVRIRVKRLRYGCEFFAPAFPAARAAPYIAALKELQRILGELNDIAVARRLVGAQADESALLTSLDAAWKRLARRAPFWRAAG